MGPCVRRSNQGSGLLEANLAGYARKPPEIGAGLAPGLPPPGRGEAEPLLEEERSGQAPALHQVIYNQ